MISYLFLLWYVTACYRPICPFLEMRGKKSGLTVDVLGLGVCSLE
jgi:hypothetical protein